MSILDLIQSAQGGEAVQQLGRQFGLDDGQVSSALSALVPALTAGVRNNVQSADGLDGLLGALTGGHHQRYIDDTRTLGHASTVEDGNGILGHLFGSKDVSRQVASRAAEQTGLGQDVLKQMLPIVATLVMGAMSKRVSEAAPASAGSGAIDSGSLLGMLTPMLDANRDGSVADDVMGMVGKLLGGH